MMGTGSVIIRTASLLVSVLLAPSAAVAQGAADVELKLRGLAQVQFNTTSLSEEDVGDEASGVAATSFETRRVRLGAQAAIREWITGEVELDAALGRVRTTDAWVNLAFSEAVQLRIGQYKKPFGLIELTSSSRMLPIERGVSIRGLPEATAAAGVEDPARAPLVVNEEVLIGEAYRLLSALGYVGRDLGASLHGQLGFARWGVGVFNGEGADRRDVNDGKSLAARVVLEPFDMPLAIGAGVSRRETRPQGDAGELSGTAVGVDAQWGALGARGLFAQLEASAGDNFFPAGTMRGLQGVVGWFQPVAAARLEGVEPFFRVSYGDADTDRANDAGVLLTPGVNVYLFGRNRLMLNWDVYMPSAEWLETAHALRAQAQLAF